MKLCLTPVTDNLVAVQLLFLHEAGIGNCCRSFILLNHGMFIKCNFRRRISFLCVCIKMHISNISVYVISHIQQVIRMARHPYVVHGKNFIVGHYVETFQRKTRSFGIMWKLSQILLYLSYLHSILISTIYSTFSGLWQRSSNSLGLKGSFFN